MANVVTDGVIYPEKFRRMDHDGRSRKIIEAAKGVFLRNGFDGASMDEIALAAGVSKRTVYNRYASKEDLFEDVARNACENIFPFDLQVCFKTPVREFLIDVAEKLVRAKTMPEAIALQRLVAFQSHRMPHVGDAYMTHVARPFIDSLSHYLEQQSALGRLGEFDPREAAWTFRTLACHPLVTKILMSGREPDEMDSVIAKQAASSVDQFLKIYGPA